MTKPDSTLIAIVLDRSGSMSSCAQDTIGGFNTFIEEQRKQPGECLVTLTQFDNEYEIAYSAKPIAEVPSLDFRPRGGTALLDAIGRTINETGARLSSMTEDERPSKVLFVILTDGEENSSHEFTNARVKEMIEHQSQSYGWEFVYLGANQDAFSVAGSWGIAAGSTLNYNSGNTRASFAAASLYASASRSGVAAAFTEADRKANS